jgi:L-amino acid N-acyltransferase YncA
MSPASHIIEPAASTHAAELARIYNHHIVHGTGTFEEEPISVEEMDRRVGTIVGRGWPWLVAKRNGIVLGYAYAGIFRDRTAYRFTCEDSVYVDPAHQGKGLGTALLAALLLAAREADFERMIAVIGDSDNLGSIRVHEAAGFDRSGCLKKAGLKFGRYLDVVLMQREL